MGEGGRPPVEGGVDLKGEGSGRRGPSEEQLE